MRKFLLLSLLAGFIVLAAVTLRSCFRQPDIAQDELDRLFKEMMTGATLVGRSSRLNNDHISGEEKYVIDGVTKVAGDTWLFRARFEYSGRSIPLPIPVSIRWAGDTPVITITDLAIPGMGSYTARVVLYRDQYAGTWSGKNGGGQIFGKIVRHQ